MNLGLEGKLCLVTGSTAGIGKSIAESLAREGAQVIVNGRTESSVQAAIVELSKIENTHFHGFAGDLSTPNSVAKLLSEFPEIDILVNNLGIYEPKAFEDITDAEWMRIFDVNVMSGVRLSRALLPYMKEKDWGRVVFISSESAVQIPAEMIHYGMTKTAQLSVARGLAEHLSGTGITVNSVLPGPTRSRGVSQFLNDYAEKNEQTVESVEAMFFKDVRPTSLIQRFADPSEIAAMVTYICSEAASATTGASLRVDGGVVRSIF